MQPTNIHRGEKQHIEYINGIDRGQRSINKEDISADNSERSRPQNSLNMK